MEIAIGRSSEGMYHLFIVIILTAGLWICDSAPLSDDSQESRSRSASGSLDVSQSGYTPEEFYQTSEPQMSDSISDGNNDAQCKEKLQVEAEQCLKDFEHEKEVFENPNLTTRQRKKLRTDFCRSHDMSLQCLYFALQKCSAEVVTDFLPFIELRIGVWKPYMDRLCVSHNNHENKDQHNVPQGKPNSGASGGTTSARDETSTISTSSSKTMESLEVQNNFATTKTKSRINSKHHAFSKAKVIKVPKLSQSNHLKITAENSAELDFRPDCSLEENFASPHCVHIANLMSSSPGHPSQTMAFLVTTAVLFFHIL